MRQSKLFSFLSEIGRKREKYVFAVCRPALLRQATLPGKGACRTCPGFIGSIFPGASQKKSISPKGVGCNGFPVLHRNLRYLAQMCRHMQKRAAVPHLQHSGIHPPVRRAAERERGRKTGGENAGKRGRERTPIPMATEQTEVRHRRYRKKQAYGVSRLCRGG